MEYDPPLCLHPERSGELVCQSQSGLLAAGRHQRVPLPQHGPSPGGAAPLVDLTTRHRDPGHGGGSFDRGPHRGTAGPAGSGGSRNWILAPSHPLRSLALPRTTNLLALKPRPTHDLLDVCKYL